MCKISIDVQTFLSYSDTNFTYNLNLGFSIVTLAANFVGECAKKTIDVQTCLSYRIASLLILFCNGFIIT